MIRKLALLAGAGFVLKKLLDKSRDQTATADRAPPRSTRFQANAAPASPGHAPTDLLGEHPNGSVRADEHFRPDPTAPVAPEDREGLRPVTAPAPHDPPGR